jgi:hypothetical protein
VHSSIPSRCVVVGCNQLPTMRVEVIAANAAGPNFTDVQIPRRDLRELLTEDREISPRGGTSPNAPLAGQDTGFSLNQSDA